MKVADCNGRRIFLLTFIGLLIFASGHSQNLDSLLQNKRVYTALSIEDTPAPKIDGLLEDAAWELGEWQGDFTQQQPYGNTKGTERTYIKILFDYSNLYVAIICQDSDPSKIRDIFDRRDALTGDMTGIAIDSYYDKRTAFEFNLSAAGQKMDLKHLGDYQWDFNWDAIWDGATSKCDSGWIAEMRVPFSQIRYTDQEEHVWGMHVWRWIDRKKEEDQWQYIPLEAPAMVYLFGKLEGVNNIRSSRQVEFLPYMLGSLDSYPGSSVKPAINTGIDAKIGISSDYTLDLSVNPDFGQVEADPSVLNLTSFETFYEEKRPFFLEGNDIFDFDLDGDIPYYSRRIGSAPGFPSYYDGNTVYDIPTKTTILSAAKLTGKSSNGLSFGLVNGLTAREYGKYDLESGNVEEIEVSPLSNYMATRIKKEFKEGNSSVGAYIGLVNRFEDGTPSEFLFPSNAYTAGVDMLHQWKNRNYYLEAKLLGSQLNGSSEAILAQQLAHNHRFQRIDADYLEVDSTLEQLSGSGGAFKIGKKGGKVNFYAAGSFRSPGLNMNDMGYMSQADYIGQEVGFTYKMNEPREHIRNYRLDLTHESQWSFGGEINSNVLESQFSITNQKLWSLSMSLGYHFTHYDTRQLRGGPALRNDPYYSYGLGLSSNTSKDFYAYAGLVHQGSSVDYFLHNTYYTTFTWMPVRRLRFSGVLALSENKYYQMFVQNFETETGLKSVVANLDRKTNSITLRGEIFFTPEISLQYYGNPYFSVGNYSSYRMVAQASNKDHAYRYTDLELYPTEGEDSFYFTMNDQNYTLNSLGDFSYLQYRSNIVFRWEYKLGSTLYLVWSHDRTGGEAVYNPLFSVMDDILGLKGTNIFMLKLNYWFSL